MEEYKLREIFVHINVHVPDVFAVQSLFTCICLNFSSFL